MNIENAPLVSVLMATYNDQEKYFYSAINSILNQTYGNLELIIVDDSNDEKFILCLKKFQLQDKRIKLIKNKNKLGFVKSLNLGINTAQGEYIARMDSDDIAMPNRIEKQVMYLIENKDVAILGTDIHIIDDDNIVTGSRKYKTSYQEIKNVAFFRNPLAHPTVMYRRKNIKELGLYDEKFSMAEDYELWLRAINKRVVINNLPEKLLNYRICRDYYKKRNKKNWHYNIKAKYKNFYIGIKPISGLVFSIIMYMLPQNVIRILYNLDRGKNKV